MKLFTVILLTLSMNTLVGGFTPIQVHLPKRIFTFQMLDHCVIDCHDDAEFSRRDWFKRSADSVAFAAGLVSLVEPSEAGLVQFPVDYQLMNTYHIMRSGESLLESQDILSSNPLFLTNREDALSELGFDQVLNVCKELKEKEIDPSLVKYSIAAKSMDTANIIANEMMVGRNRVVPEYTFMDPRGVGAWDRKPLSSTEEAIWAMDEAEAGHEGKGARPPPNDDGTPNETLAEQTIRLRQLMSVLETQCSGDTILLVFVDGTSPALLMSLIAGIPLNQVHELNLDPGEIRYDITKEKVLEMWQSQTSTAYIDKLSRGRKNLQSLREDLREEETIDRTLKRTENSIAPVMKKRDKPTELNSKSSQHRSKRRESSVSVIEVKDQTVVSLNTTSLIGLGAIGCFGSLQRQTKSASNDTRNESAFEVEELNDALPPERGEQNDIEEAPELKKMESLALMAPIEIPEMNLSSDGDIEDAEKDRMEQARIAMESYLNRDDGGEDWLSHMSMLANDEE